MKLKKLSRENNLNSMEFAVRKLRAESKNLSTLSASIKSSILLKLADRILLKSNKILKANAMDLNSLGSETSSAFRDRLALSQNRIESMAKSLCQVARLADPVGEVIENRTLKNGLKIKKVRAPLGVILMIFESRPNVILEAFSLAFKSGNAIILRGGRESKNTANTLYKIMNEVFHEFNFKNPLFLGIKDYDRKIVHQLLGRNDLIDIVVPRGGEGLITYVQKNATMPLIKNDRGMCHTFVDESADMRMAVAIVKNAKTQRPSVCNALETVLVHRNCAEKFIPQLFLSTLEIPLEWHADLDTIKILNSLPDAKKSKLIRKATTKDWDTEYLDFKINCKIVDNLDEAIKHITVHGSKHSEAIITRNSKRARKFQEEVDAAAVYWNASTRFTDGFEFGLGGELGISTQKLHVRGPVGLRELTTPRWIITGSGQIRN